MKKWHYFLIIGLIFLLGIGIRLIDITDHPFEIHGARQMRSALISRDLLKDQSPENVWVLKKRVFRNLQLGGICYLIGFLV